MNQLDKKKFELTVEIVQNTIRGLCLLYNEFGIDGMHELTNPSLAQLKDILSKMKDEVGHCEISYYDKDGVDALSALISIQNIKQGIMYAESLLLGIERYDPEFCQQAQDDIKSNSIIVPSWSDKSNS